MLLKKWQLSHLGMKFAEKSVTIWILKCQLLLFKIKYTGYTEVHWASQHNRPGHAGESPAWGHRCAGEPGGAGAARSGEGEAWGDSPVPTTTWWRCGRTGWALQCQDRRPWAWPGGSPGSTAVPGRCWALCRDREVLRGFRESSRVTWDWSWALLRVGGYWEVPPASISLDFCEPVKQS